MAETDFAPALLPVLGGMSLQATDVAQPVRPAAALVSVQATQVSAALVKFEVQPQTVTGSRGGNAAIAALLTALQTRGLIVDKTTA